VTIQQQYFHDKMVIVFFKDYLLHNIPANYLHALTPNTGITETSFVSLKLAIPTIVEFGALDEGRRRWLQS